MIVKLQLTPEQFAGLTDFIASRENSDDSLSLTVDPTEGAPQWFISSNQFRFATILKSTPHKTTIVSKNELMDVTLEVAEMCQCSKPDAIREYVDRPTPRSYLANLVYAMSLFPRSEYESHFELLTSQFHLALEKYCREKSMELFWDLDAPSWTLNPDAMFMITDHSASAPPDKNTWYYFLVLQRKRYRDDDKTYVPELLQRAFEHRDWKRSDKDKHEEWLAGFEMARIIILMESAADADKILQSLRQRGKGVAFWVSSLENPLVFRTAKDFETATYSFPK